MYVSVSNGEVSLAEAEDTNSFKVVVSGADDADLGSILQGSHWGWLDGGEAMISVEAVQRGAAGQVGPNWSESFGRMLDYARIKGWLAADGTAIRAHVEHGGVAG